MVSLATQICPFHWLYEVEVDDASPITRGANEENSTVCFGSTCSTAPISKQCYGEATSGGNVVAVDIPRSILSDPKERAMKLLSPASRTMQSELFSTSGMKGRLVPFGRSRALLESIVSRDEVSRSVLSPLAQEILQRAKEGFLRNYAEKTIKRYLCVAVKLQVLRGIRQVRCMLLLWVIPNPQWPRHGNLGGASRFLSAIFTPHRLRLV